MNKYKLQIWWVNTTDICYFVVKIVVDEQKKQPKKEVLITQLQNALLNFSYIFNYSRVSLDEFGYPV